MASKVGNSGPGPITLAVMVFLPGLPTDNIKIAHKIICHPSTRSFFGLICGLQGTPERLL